jgi:hypothetical protein
VPRRSPLPGPGRALAALLISVLAAAPAAAGWADPIGGATETSTAAVDTPTQTDTAASVAPTNTSTSVGAATPTPNPPPTTPGGSTTQTPGMLGVTVLASNAVLGPQYWSGARASSFVITVRNTGTVPAHTTLTYTLPPGIDAAGTGDCPHGTCTVEALDPGRSASLTVPITVGANAWRTAPLTGKIDFSATAPQASPANGTANWSVVFPPGPPAPGIALQVADVTLDSDPTDPGELVIQLTNTGGRPGAALIEVVVPPGVVVTRLTAECQSQRQVNSITTECGLGTIGPKVQRAIGVMLAVSDVVRADAPLAGLVRASLTPSGQSTLTTQASYQILAPQAQAGVNVAATASAGTSPDAAASANPAALPIILGSILLLALVGVGLVLRPDLLPRRGLGPGRPWSAGTGPWRPVATFAPPLTATGSPVTSTAPATAPLDEPDGAHAADPPVGMAVAPDRPHGQEREDRPGGQEPEDRPGQQREYMPSPVGAEVSDGPDGISLVWTELPDAAPPPGRLEG